MTPTIPGGVCFIMLLAAAGASLTWCAPDAVSVMQRAGSYWDTRVGCTGSAWRESVAALPTRNTPVTFVNVGANKGYSAVEFLGLWSQHRLDGLSWSRMISDHASKQSAGDRPCQACGLLRHAGEEYHRCGNCMDCRRPLPPKHGRKGAKIHLLELTVGSRELLRHLINASHLSDEVFVHNFAASNTTQLVWHRPFRTGDEMAYICQGERSKECPTAKQAITVDHFLRQQNLDDVYQIEIDTEGTDPLVLEGMRETLAQRRVAIVEFEVSDIGYWKLGTAESRSLRRIIRRFEDAGYTCWWDLADSLGLVPMSGACWADAFDTIRRWSNVVCSHKPAMVATLKGFARQSYKVRSRAQLDSHGIPRTAPGDIICLDKITCPAGLYIQ